MENEAQEILRTALAQEPAQAQNLADAIRRRVEPLGGVELSLPPRADARTARLSRLYRRLFLGTLRAPPTNPRAAASASLLRRPYGHHREPSRLAASPNTAPRLLLNRS